MALVTLWNSGGVVAYSCSRCHLLLENNYSFLEYPKICSGCKEEFTGFYGIDFNAAINYVGPPKKNWDDDL